MGPPFSRARWRKISPYLEQALELPEDERLAFVEQLRPEDPVLAAELRVLLEEREAAVQAAREPSSPDPLPLPWASHADSRGVERAGPPPEVRLRRGLRLTLGVVLMAGVTGLVATLLIQVRRAGAEVLTARAAGQRGLEQVLVAQGDRDLVLRQLARAEAVHDFHAQLLDGRGAGGKALGNDGAGSEDRDWLVRAEQALERRQDDVETRAELLFALGGHYRQREQPGQARRVLEEARRLARGVPEGALQARVACALASALIATGEPEPAERLIREGDEALQSGPQPLGGRVGCLLASAELARVNGSGGRAIERAQAARRLLGSPGISSAGLEAAAARELALAYRASDRHAEAVPAFAEAFGRLISIGREDSPAAVRLLDEWALSVQTLGRPLEAERLFRRALEIDLGRDRSAAVAGPVDPAPPGAATDSAPVSRAALRGRVLANLARVLRDLSRLDQALSAAEQAEARARRLGDEVLLDQVLLVRASIYRQRGDLPRAGRLLIELGPRLSRLPAGHLAFATLASEEGLLAQARGDLGGALAGADRAVELARASTGSRVHLARFLRRRADVQLARRRFAESQADAVAALRLEEQVVDKGEVSSSLGLAQLALGRALAGGGESERARSAFSAALLQLEPALGPEHPDTRAARQLAARAAATN